MGLSNLFQNAGDNSTQTSIQTMNVYQGITEERAREICKEEYAVVARDMTQEAISIANERVGQLADKLLTKMASYDEQLSAFADPAFQLALRKAQMSAACTDSESDYDLLSELLIERAKVKNDKGKQVGITKALEIVGQVSDEALMGLAVTYITTKLKAISDDLEVALALYNKVLSEIIGDKQLPQGREWMEELDILRAIRINPLGINKSKKYFSEVFAEHLVLGVEKDSEEYQRIKDELFSLGISADVVLKPHPLRPNFVKLITNDDVRKLQLIQTYNSNTVTVGMTPAQEEMLQKVALKLRREGAKQVDMQAAFMQEWDKYPYLKMLREWRDVLAYAPILTPVGAVLANAYTRTIDASIPKI